MSPDSDFTPIGRTNLREPHVAFGIKQRDRLAHLYVIGQTGAGKSTLLEGMVRDDIVHGRGCALFDPHGDLVERIASSVPPWRASDTIYLNAPDPLVSWGYNPLLHVSEKQRPMVASGLIDVFKRMWSDAWGVRMEHILRNALLALLDQPRAALPDILSMLASSSFRAGVVARVENQQVRAFWTNEFPKYSFRNQADGIAPIQNKVGAFLADPKLRRLLTPKDGGLRLRKIMDEGKVLLVNLSEGKLGTDSARLLGGMLVTALGSAGMSRAQITEARRRPFNIVIDEFQEFTTLALASMLSQLRKYGVSMTLAHQYVRQLDPAIEAAVIGNAGTLISFRLGGIDAPLIARELSPVFTADDLVCLPNFHIALRLMIDGQPSRPFSATTLPL